jgi:hypothetical protein
MRGNETIEQISRKTTEKVLASRIHAVVIMDKQQMFADNQNLWYSDE